MCLGESTPRNHASSSVASGGAVLALAVLHHSADCSWSFFVFPRFIVKIEISTCLGW